MEANSFLNKTTPIYMGGNIEIELLPLKVYPYTLKINSAESCTAVSRGRTYVMIPYSSKENDLGPDDKIRYIWGLKGPIFSL